MKIGDKLIFRTIITHAMEISNNGVKSIEFFNESNKNDRSITDYNESEIVNWIMKKDSWFNHITQELLNKASKEFHFHLEVREPLLNKEEQKIIGDIDMIIIPKEDITKSVSIEFKRIKISSVTNKLNKLETAKRKGFSQIKKMLKFNYHQTYLGIIIEDDAREMITPNTFIRDSNDESLKQIFNINKDNKLEDESGIFFIKLTQPTGENINFRSNFGVCLCKSAKKIAQSEATTNKIRKLLEERNLN
jgi:hypothetical protein